VTAVVIASQLPPPFNDAVAQRIAAVDIVSVPPGPPQALPSSARIMLAGPFPNSSAPAPEGWPFGLAWIHLASTGIDSYPRWLFSAPSVTTSRGITSVALAEFALAAMLAEAKRFPALWIDDAARWRPTPRLALLEEATLGLFGAGAIAQALIPRAQALGMRVLVARNTARPIELPGVLRVADIAELLERADHLVLAAPLTPATRHVLNRDALARAKPGIHIVNVARGGLIDDDALLEALQTGLVGRASLDATDPEPLPAGHPYYRHPRVFLSPHASVHTPATPRRFAEKFADNFARFQSGSVLMDRVDPALGY
jgi:phosphoglycerate dehydrogenase-like enzyme